MSTATDEPAEDPTEVIEGEVMDDEITAAEVVDLFSRFIATLEPADLPGIIKAIEAEPITADAPEDRRREAMNRADRAELVRQFLALRDAGRGIVRRLQDDEEGRERDE